MAFSEKLNFTLLCNVIINFEGKIRIIECLSFREGCLRIQGNILFHQIQNVNALMKTIQPKKQQQQQQQQHRQLQLQQLPLVWVLVLLKYADGLGMATVMTAQIIWIAILTVEIVVAPM